MVEEQTQPPRVLDQAALWHVLIMSARDRVQNMAPPST